MLDWFEMHHLRQNLTRRLAESNRDLEVLYSFVKAGFENRSAFTDEKHNEDLICDELRGMYAGLRGQRRLKAPDEWRDFLRLLSRSENPEVKENAIALAVLFGDPEAVKSLMQVVSDSKSPRPKREDALQTLLELKAPEMARLLEELLSDQTMRSATIRALASLGDEKTPQLLLERYTAFTDAEKSDAIATLTSCAAYAMALLDAMEAGKVPRRDLSPFAARQLLTFKDKALTDKLTKVWGTLRPAQDKSVLMAKYFGITAPEALKRADRSHGRLVFNQTCAKCHVLFGEGIKIGPDLTGSQRTHAEYLLTKLLDPSATVAKDYQLTIIATKGGRTVSGIVKEENDKVVAIQTENEVVRIAKADIEARDQSKQSMMPEGQLEKLSDAEVRDLFAYLAGSGQVPLPPKK
jgi:putative heme-binding domain-containing protein